MCVGCLIKHVTQVEKRWAAFISGDPDAFGVFDEAAYAAHAASFAMTGDDTLEDLLAAYQVTAKRTDDLVRSLPDLDVEYPLPVTPWWPEGSRWSARRAIVHVVAETAQHAGHADIIREAIDGQKSMG